MFDNLALDLELILRILIACLCGAAIGTERTVRLKEAGIRTHTIVAMGAALMMTVSKYGFLDKAVFGGNFDGSRIASCVVTGISFLGAGVIFVRGNNIKGLTTSAGIWATAGIGLALGAGMYVVGISATAVLVLVQFILHRFIGRLDNMVASEILLTVIYSPDMLNEVTKTLHERGFEVTKSNATKGPNNTVTLRLSVVSERQAQINSLVDIFEQNENIISFSL